MFHIGKSGSPTRCRAIVRPCPLGGEARLFAELGIEGPARPSPVEAREHGMYEAIYGAQLKKRAEAEARRTARRAERAAQAGAVNPRHSPEYAAQVESVRTQLAEFKDKHADTLKNSSGTYFMARQTLTAAEQEYLDDLDAVGNSLNELVAAGVSAQDVEPHDVVAAQLKEMEEERKALVDERNAKVSAVWSRSHSYETVIEDAGKIGKQYDPEITQLRQEIKDLKKTVEKKYEATYGAAYKAALEDIGVEFTDGSVAYAAKVKNADSVSDDFAQEQQAAMSYYPAEWMENVKDEDVLVNKRYKNEGGYAQLWYRSPDDPRPSMFLESGSYNTSIHEWGHLMEDTNYELGRAQRLFLIQEKKHSSHRSVIKFDSSKSLATDSMVRPYSGAYYRGGTRTNDDRSGNNYEVLTTGTEALFGGDSGGFRTGDDSAAPRHRNFILGLFATQATTTPPAGSNEQVN